MKCAEKNKTGNSFNLSIVLLIIGLVLGCSLMKGVSEADESVEKFHSRFNNEKFDEIYENCSRQLKNSGDRDDFVNILKNLKRKMGNVEKATRRNYQSNTTNGDTIVEIEYDTEFSNGKAREEFQYHKEDNELKLQYYKYKLTE